MLANMQPTVRAYGDSALLLEWNMPPGEALLLRIQRLQELIQEDASLFGQTNAIVPAYQSLTIVFKHCVKDRESVAQHIQRLASTPMDEAGQQRTYKRWSVPVCYDSSLAKDQASYLEQTGLSVEQFIELHTGVDYLVCFIGFLPGFLYLDGLVARLHLPRKATPSASIPKGAVAIGGVQTGVYPQASPGGWHVIGQTPLAFFKPQNAIPCFAKPGDRIRFKPIGLNEFESLSGRISEPSCEEVNA